MFPNWMYLVQCALETLNADPSSIITLLERSKACRASWMMVSGHYRRKGLLKPAYVVVVRMLEGMRCVLLEMAKPKLSS